MIAYIALLSALLSRLIVLVCGSTWVTSFIARSLNIHQSGVLTVLAWLVPHKTAAISAQVLCTPYNHAPCHFMQSHIRKVYACLAVTCHLHFWQNDRDLLRATAVTQGGTDTEIKVAMESAVQELLSNFYGNISTVATELLINETITISTGHSYNYIIYEPLTLTLNITNQSFQIMLMMQNYTKFGLVVQWFRQYYKGQHSLKN